jgi:cysteine desulfurase
LLDIAGDHATVIGLGAPRVANTLLIAMRDIGSETQVMAMDLSGVAVSSGSACSSGKTKASHVLRAMGYGDDIAGCSLRISMGWNTQDRDIERCVEAWEGLYERTHRQIRKSQAA